MCVCESEESQNSVSFLHKRMSNTLSQGHRSWDVEDAYNYNMKNCPILPALHGLLQCGYF